MLARQPEHSNRFAKSAMAKIVPVADKALDHQGLETQTNINGQKLNDQSGDKGAKIIVVGNEKGGSGKSTTAIHLIVWLLQHGYSVASLDLDPRQASLTRYLENRKEAISQTGRDLALPEHFVAATNISNRVGAAIEEDITGLKQLIGALQRQHDFLVIDTPGFDSDLSRIGHSYADLLVTPVNDSFVDLDLLGRIDGRTGKVVSPSAYSQMVWEGRQERGQRDGGNFEWVVFRNRLSQLPAKNKEQVGKALNKLAKRVGFRMVAGFSERVVFRDLFLSGLTIIDQQGRFLEKGWAGLRAAAELRLMMADLQLVDEVRRKQYRVSG